MPTRQNRAVGVPTAGGSTIRVRTRIGGVSLSPKKNQGITIAGGKTLAGQSIAPALPSGPQGVQGFLGGARRGSATARAGRAAAGSSGVGQRAPQGAVSAGRNTIPVTPVSGTRRSAPIKPAAAIIKRVTSATKKVSKGTKRLS